MQRAARQATAKAGIDLINAERNSAAAARREACGFRDLPPQGFEPRLSRLIRSSHFVLLSFSYFASGRPESMSLNQWNTLCFVLFLYPTYGMPFSCRLDS